MRTIIAGVLTLMLAVSACGDDEEMAAPPPTASATATAQPSALDYAIWPAPEDAGTDPLATARSLVTDYVGVDRPALSEFRQGDARSGEVEVYRTGEDGRRLDAVVATIALRQLEGDEWYVIAVHSPEVELETPEPLEEIGSPVRVAGRGRGFEGNVVLQVRAAFATEPLAQEAVTAGSMADREPFAVELSFELPDTATGAILATTGSGITVADGFAALPVRIAR